MCGYWWLKLFDKCVRHRFWSCASGRDRKHLIAPSVLKEVQANAIAHAHFFAAFDPHTIDLHDIIITHVLGDCALFDNVCGIKKAINPHKISLSSLDSGLSSVYRAIVYEFCKFALQAPKFRGKICIYRGILGRILEY